MEDWIRVYKKNKYLDDIFFQKYSDEKLMYEKNCIEFLVEFGEFINETKCFKYWSIKVPEKDQMLEEIADVFTMLMYFYNIMEINIVKYENLNSNKNLLELLNDTYALGTKLYKHCDQKLLENIFKNLIIISKILNISEDEIIEAIDKKHIIIEERLNTNY